MKTILYYALFAIAFLVVFRDPNGEAHQGIGRRYLQATVDTVKPYGQLKIERAAPLLNTFSPRLLAFDGENFLFYNLKHNHTVYNEDHDFNNRPVMIIPLLVHALKTKHPERFQKGQPPFQLLFTEADSLRTNCVNDDKNCYTDEWPPILVFGSLMKDAPRTFPSAKLMPVPPFMECMYKLVIKGDHTCQWAEQSEEMMPFKELKPTIIWRGSDYAFLFQYDKFRFKDTIEVFGSDIDGLTKEDVAVRIFQNWNDIGPRWRGIALTLQAEIENVQKSEPVWLDSKFAGTMPGMDIKTLDHFKRIGVHVSSTTMDTKAMSAFRYQIDFGGGGGTTWCGTLTKLSMPGTLFHHETPTKDWFHDEMEPWKHYIPVNWDLTDLRAKYDWAEANVGKVTKMSEEATKLSKYLLSPGYMHKVYDDLFEDYLGKVVEAYRNQQPAWTDSLRRYKKMGFELQELATCDAEHCTIRAEREQSVTSSRVLRYMPEEEDSSE